jgi:hypothetical protein
MEPCCMHKFHTNEMSGSLQPVIKTQPIFFPTIYQINAADKLNQVWSGWNFKQYVVDKYMHGMLFKVQT